MDEKSKYWYIVIHSYVTEDHDCIENNFHDIPIIITNE